MCLTAHELLQKKVSSSPAPLGGSAPWGHGTFGHLMSHRGSTSLGSQPSEGGKLSKAPTQGVPAADNLAHQSSAGLDHIHLHPAATVTCPNDSCQDKRKGQGTGS